MTTREQQEQIESGKKIVKEMLANLATEFHESRVNDLTFEETDQDWNSLCISLRAPEGDIVAKIQNKDLADCPAKSEAGQSVRRKLESQLRQAVGAFYKPQQ